MRKYAETGGWCGNSVPAGEIVTVQTKTTREKQEETRRFKLEKEKRQICVNPN
jgi:hypothetical protein